MLTFDQVAALLDAHPWRFASTMPDNPHWYTLRRQWKDDDAFVEVVRFIRLHGYQHLFRGRPYTQFDLNDHWYWTMGAPLPNTILINRALHRHPAPYDLCADEYDDLYRSPENLAENAEVAAMLHGLENRGPILDVGCGTGLLLDIAIAPISEYVGIDPSRRMLARLQDKHPGRRTVATPLRSFWSPDRFGTVVALFGAASYLTDMEVQRATTLGDRFFLMFYRPGYQAQSDTLIMSRDGRDAATRLATNQHWTDLLPPGSTITEFSHYLIAEGHRGD